MDFLRRTPGRARTPMDVQFLEAWRGRPVDLVSPEFVQHRDTFGGQKGVAYERLAPAPESSLGEVDRRYGTLSVSQTEPAFTLFRSERHPEVPYASVVVDVKAFASHGLEQDTVFAGLVQDERNYVMAWFSGVAGTAGIDAMIDGELQSLGARESHFIAPCRVAFVMTGTTVAALVEQQDGFRPLATGRVPEDLEFRRPATLASYHYGFGVRSSTGTVVVNAVEAGHFGQIGLRDPRLVTHADGTPYTRFRSYYLTMSHAGFGFFDAAHWGVWKFDPARFQFENVAKLFFQREGSEAVLGDHSGHLVRDEDNDRWVVANSTWGDFTGERVEVRHTTVPLSTDLLRGVHVLGSEPLPLPLDKLPTAAVGQWDPHIVRIGDRWHVAFVNAREFFDFYPALAVSDPGGPLTDLTLVGADPTKNETGGVALTRFAGQWYLLASSGADSAVAADRSQFPVYNLSMGRVGALDAPHASGIPWPTLLPLPAKRDQARWVMVTFDGTRYDREVLGYGSHGDLVVLEGEQVTSGEFSTG